MRNVQQRTLHDLGRSFASVARGGPGARPAQVLDAERRNAAAVPRVVTRRPAGKRIRCHGNLGLGELLFTGKDFVIIDFEGEPDVSLGERRVKRPPLGDVATMVRSFHHAAVRRAA